MCEDRTQDVLSASVKHTMKILRSIFLFTLLAMAGGLSAQDVLDKIARESCDCLTAVDRATIKGDALQMQLGLCMMKAAAPYEKELRKQYKVDMARLDSDTGERLGELVGMRLVGVCPEFLEMITEMQGEAEVATADVPTASVNGTVTSLRDRQFSTVLVKDGSGRTVELMRLEHFPNADMLTGANATGLSATFYYTVRELYDPVAGTYRSTYVLVGLETE